MGIIIFFLLNLSFLPIDSLKPHMKGYGLSTFFEVLPETFYCEILDIMKDIEPKRNLIIAKLSGANLEKTGIIAGMSGSPVFINNKLIGAVAYAWEFQKEPICGITPIYEMLYPESFPKMRNWPPRNFNLPIALNTKLNEKEESLFNTLFPKNIKPLFLPMGGKESIDKEMKIDLGYPVGGLLVDGDLKIAAIGTLTYIAKDTIYAFGHPFFNFGELELPLILGKIHCVMPAYDNSFKLFSPVKEIGKINYDYQTAIKGVLNKEAKKLPLKITIKDDEKKEEYFYQIANHYKLIPILLPLCFSSSFSSFTLGMPLNYTIKNKIKLKISLKDKIKTLEYEKLQVSDEAKSFTIFDFQEDLQNLLENPFEKVAIKEGEIESYLIKEKKSVRILDILLNKTIFYPRDSLILKIIFQDFQGKFFTKEFKIELNLNPGQYSLFVGSFEDFFSLFPLREIKNFSSLLDYIKMKKPGNLLKLAIYSFKKGFYLKDKGYSLPLSLKRLKEKSQEEVSPFTLHYENNFSFDYFIVNSKTINMEVKE